MRINFSHNVFAFLHVFAFFHNEHEIEKSQNDMTFHMKCQSLWKTFNTICPNMTGLQQHTFADICMISARLTAPLCRHSTESLKFVFMLISRRKDAREEKLTPKL